MANKESQYHDMSRVAGLPQLQSDAAHVETASHTPNLQAGSVARAQSAPGSLKPGDVSWLQRTLGNQAVLQILRARSPNSSAAGASPKPMASNRLMDRQVIQRVGKKTVTARVWLVRLGETAPELELEEVQEAVKAIWEEAVTLEFGETRRIALEEPEANLRPHEFKEWVAEGVAREVNAAIVASEGERTIDVVFVPKFGAWGQAYTRLVSTRPGEQEGSFAPFEGPVAIVTTAKTADIRGKLPLERRKQLKPADEAQPADEIRNNFVHLGIVNDAAHEIGHLFGLKHTTEEREGAPTVKPAAKQIHWLMHPTAYTELQKQGEGRSVDTAKGLIKAEARPYIRFVGKDEDNEWYVALRGIRIADADVELAKEKIASGEVWPPGWIAEDVEDESSEN